MWWGGAHVGAFNYGPPRNPAPPRSGVVPVSQNGPMSDSPHETEEMKIEQADRETAERAMAADDPTEAGTAQHDRRADKAAYLKEKLAEREESEREAEED